MKIFASAKEQDFEYNSEYKNELHHLFFEGSQQDFDFTSLGNGRYSLLKNNRSYLVHLTRRGDVYHVHTAGAHFEIDVEDERMRKVKELVHSSSSGPSEMVVKAPIPGVIMQVNVQEGESINKGQPLLILEAMKMENVIKANCDCQVEKVLVSESEAVQLNQDLIRLVTAE